MSVARVWALLAATLLTSCQTTPTPPPASEPEEGAPVGITNDEPHPAQSAYSSRYDPPADLAHLDETSVELRQEIDSLIATLLDPEAGRECLDARERLVQIGKPAFPRLLGAMAAIRDRLTDEDTREEKLLQSSLCVADLTLRDMDGYLDANRKQVIRPGSDTRYIAYICRLHYKRWQTVLKEMPSMPGPFDPSRDEK